MIKQMKTMIEYTFLFLSLYSIIYVVMNFGPIYSYTMGAFYLNDNSGKSNITNNIDNNEDKEEESTFLLYDNADDVKNSNEYTAFNGEKIVDSIINTFTTMKNDPNNKVLYKENIVKKDTVKETKVEKVKEVKKREDTTDFFSLSYELNDFEKGKYGDQSYVVIPKIDVEVPIFYPSINTENLEDAILKILEKGVAHRPETQLPYQKGNFFILGHSSNFPWIKSEYNNIFAKIDLLEEGDEAVVYYEGRKYIYSLYEKKIVDQSALEVYGYLPGYNLSVMTCYPIGSVKNRMIAKFKLQVKTDL